MRTGSMASSNRKIIRAIFAGTLSGVVLCGVLLAAAAFLFTKSSNIAHTVVEPLVLIFAGIGAFVGGYISSRISGEKGMMYGLTCGFLMFVLFFIGGLIAAGESITMVTLIRFLLMLLTGSVGGIVGVNKR